MLDASRRDPACPVKVGDALHGEGLFARKAFKPGDLVVADPALARLQIRFTDSGDEGDLPLLDELLDALLASEECENLFLLRHRFFLGLPSSKTVAVYNEWAEQAKWPSHIVSDDDRQSIVEAMRAVAFNAYNSRPGCRYYMMYPIIAKANHSCFPNASVVAPETGSGQLICLRPIEPGDEILVSYINDGQLVTPACRRLGYLLENWEFVCDCKRCNARVDDARRFSCPSRGCSGRCLALRTLEDTPGMLRFSSCDTCATEPSGATIASWAEQEQEVDSLIQSLPHGMFSAWALCEDFASAHPDHWLVERWKRHLAAHVEQEALNADTPEEAAELRAEAEAHRQHARRCRDATVGVELEVTILPAS